MYGTFRRGVGGPRGLSHVLEKASSVGVIDAATLRRDPDSPGDKEQALKNLQDLQSSISRAMEGPTNSLTQSITEKLSSGLKQIDT